MTNEKNNLEIIRHSLSHILAMAVKELYPDVKFAIGPAIENGFYYDFDFGKESPKEEDLVKIEKKMKHLLKQQLVISNYELVINEALARAEKDGQIYKTELIKELKNQGEKKVFYYAFGDFTDLCRGPHLKKISEIKKDAFKLDKLAGAYWRGSEKNKMLTRIYGLAFETKEELDEYLKTRKEMEARNHRKIGKEMELFAIIPEIGQGLPIWLAKGYAMRRALEDYIISFERKYGYQHILSPNIFKEDVFKISGHLDFYKENMYAPIVIDDETYYLKPMNCPASMMVYKMKPRSYRELPLKLGELGTVYRYEKTGELHGLQRVRGFTQNDAHLYCSPEQLEDIITETIKMYKEFYKAVGFDKYNFRLSLSDFSKEKYVGDKKDWERAENALRKVLKKNKEDFTESKGEAVFYGPKIDVQAINVFGKEDSISTIQIDFNLPERFDLSYIDKEGNKKRPFVIHRALIGSFERFFAFLIEHHGGVFPVWFAPVQIKIISVGEKHVEFSQKLAQEFISENIRIELDTSDETVGNKIRKAVQEKIPYVIVIGDREMANKKLAIRDRGKTETREASKEELIKEIKTKI